MLRKLTTWIIIAMLLGIVVGYACNLSAASPEQAKQWAGWFGVVTDLFLRLIKMIIAPLVFATLVTGVAHMGDTAALGRIGGRTLLWFLVASVVSLSLGMLVVNLLQPGVGLNLPLPPVDASAGVAATPSLKDFIGHVVPKSIVEAMADNEVLQIVVFSLFFGVAITAVGAPAAPLVRAVEALVQVMLRVTGYVMRVAPLGVFAAIAAAIATQGIGILVTFGQFVGGFYLALGLLWLLILGAGALVVGLPRIGLLARYIREPFLIAFSTASSEAAYPKLFEQLERFGIPKRIVSFVLPLGYSFNLDGSMMYCTFASLFIAQAYGIHLGLGQQFTMLLLLLVTSKGVAAVPRASLVVIAANLNHFGIPEAGILLILGVDVFLDMGRTGTNVVGNAVAAAVVSKWEGQLGRPSGDDPPEPAAP